MGSLLTKIKASREIGIISVVVNGNHHARCTVADGKNSSAMLSPNVAVHGQAIDRAHGNAIATARAEPIVNDG